MSPSVNHFELFVVHPYSLGMNIVIMAGGGGTRLWPLSRRANPKQFLRLGSNKTLLEQTYQRARKLVEPSSIYLATAADYAEHTKKLLPDLAADHLFLEPERRDTTAAFTTVAMRLQARGFGDEPAMYIWSDHVFSDEPAFLKALTRIPEILQQHANTLVLVAHVPISPETTLGYCEVGESLSNDPTVFWLKRFTEKPDLATAEKFVAAGTYYWNLGYFSAYPNYLLPEIRRVSPELAPSLDAYKAALVTGQEPPLTEAYSQFPKISIEYTFLEKTPRIIAITGDFGWSDIGNWATVYELFGQKGDHATHGHHVHVDSQHNFVYNDTNKTVSLIGMQDTVVVVTEDAILVTNKKDAHKVKEVVARLEKEKHDTVL